MKRFVLLSTTLLLSCPGPEAPDAAVCRDVILRVCTPPVCGSVLTTLQVGTTCEASLLSRTGCDSTNFTFTSPTREAFLQCRSLLLRNGTSVGSGASCVDIQNAFATCPGLPRFLGAP